MGFSRHKTTALHPPLKVFSLLSIFPQKVLQAQIFMGMTRCGRFLMTYSMNLQPTEDEWFDCVYRYVLHWWLFPADGLAREIGRIPLFGNAIISAPLTIYICQWPKFDDKVLVYGIMYVFF